VLGGRARGGRAPAAVWTRSLTSNVWSADRFGCLLVAATLLTVLVITFVVAPVALSFSETGWIVWAVTIACAFPAGSVTFLALQRPLFRASREARRKEAS